MHFGRLRRFDIAWAVCAGSLAMGIVFATRVRPGLPYDEPSHWTTSLAYGRLHSLPILGHTGISYEAQQGPVAYVLTSLLAGAVRMLGGSASSAFYAARALCGAELVVAIYFLYRIVGRFVDSRAVLASGLSLFALAPMFLAMGWSVQNDSLFLAISFITIEHTISSQSLSGRRAFLTGLLAGLAVVTKVAAGPLIVAIPAWYFLSKPRRLALTRSVCFIAGTAVTAGWWFVWNLVHYSHLTAPTDLGGGPDFPAYGLRGGGVATHLIQESVTYLWIPSEYYRNLLAVPTALKGLLVLVTAFLLVAGISETVVTLRRDRWTIAQRQSALLIGLIGAVALIGWVAIFVTYSSVAPRFAYVAIPAWILLATLGLNGAQRRLSGRPLGRNLVLGLPPVLCVVLSSWVLHSSALVRREPFSIDI